jgi:hypothetical protein
MRRADKILYSVLLITILAGVFYLQSYSMSKGP